MSDHNYSEAFEGISVDPGSPFPIEPTTTAMVGMDMPSSDNQGTDVPPAEALDSISMIDVSTDLPTAEEVSGVDDWVQQTTLVIGQQSLLSVTPNSPVGPPVSQAMFNFMNNLAVSVPNGKDLEEINKRHLIPENLPWVRGPLLNKKCKTNIKNVYVKNRDFSLYQVQNRVCTAVNSILRFVDDKLAIAKSTQDQKDLCPLIDSIKVLCSAQQKVSGIRRDLLRQTLKPEHRQALTSPGMRIDVTDLWSESSLEEAVEATKLDRVFSNPNPTRFHPYRFPQGQQQRYRFLRPPLKRLPARPPLLESPKNLPHPPNRGGGGRQPFTDLYTLLIPVEEFYAGRVTSFINNWKKLNISPTVLDWIKGVKVVLKENVVLPKHNYPIQYKSDSLIENEIEKLERIGAIEKVHPIEGEFLSPIFTTQNNDGTIRLILNLKRLNTFLPYEHFKMETIDAILPFIKPNMFFISFDLKSAYLTINVDKDSRKLLRFKHKQQLFQATAMMFGLAPAPRIFTKIMKVVLKHAREKGINIFLYLDDGVILARSYEECWFHAKTVILLLQDLGFILHPTKSNLIPKQTVDLLGFIIDSTELKISLRERRIQKISDTCDFLLSKEKVKIRSLAVAVGVFLSTYIAVPLARLQTRFLENDKNNSLKENKGNYEAFLQLSAASKDEIVWWKTHCYDHKMINISDTVIFTIYTDASSCGYGIFIQENNFCDYGSWTEQEQSKHINELELIAVYKSLESLKDTQFPPKSKIIIFTDNSVALSYVNKQGGRIRSLVSWCKLIWGWLQQRKISIEAKYIPSKENHAADFLSRLHENTEWSLDQSIFDFACRQLNVDPQIDLFASKVNKKLDRFYSWQHELTAEKIDAFCQTWSESSYAFPPFNLISKVLNKIEVDQTPQLLLIVPLWKSCPWYPELFSLSFLRKPLILGRADRILSNQTNKKFPIKTRMCMFTLSGKKFVNTLLSTETSWTHLKSQ